MCKTREVGHTHNLTIQTPTQHGEGDFTHSYLITYGDTWESLWTFKLRFFKEAQLRRSARRVIARHDRGTLRAEARRRPDPIAEKIEGAFKEELQPKVAVKIEDNFDFLAAKAESEKKTLQTIAARQEQIYHSIYQIR